MVATKMKLAIRILALVILLPLTHPCPASAEADREKRAPVWFYLETVPGTFSGQNLKDKIPPIQELERISHFVMGGMVYGWKFSYTPSDKKRNVDEWFSLEPIMEIDRNDNRFAMTEIVPDYPKLTCWAVFTPGDAEKRWETYWSSVVFKSANGHGTGERTEEADGVLAAYRNAIMAAVRSRAQDLEKNKPREIKGEALLRNMPRLYVDQGQFVADIKVLINIQEIVPYSTY
jgi:hypothetical protein